MKTREELVKAVDEAHDAVYDAVNIWIHTGSDSALVTCLAARTALQAYDNGMQVSTREELVKAVEEAKDANAAAWDAARSATDAARDNFNDAEAALRSYDEENSK